MVGLLDIVPATDRVKVRGGDLEVRGIGADGIAYILGRFPEVQKAVAGRGSDLNVETLLTMAPRAVNAIIAAGCGFINSPEAEAKAGELTAEEQAEVVTAVVKLTMPNGIGPFVHKLAALARSSKAVTPASTKARSSA